MPRKSKEQAPTLFVVNVYYKSGRASVFSHVVATITKMIWDAKDEKEKKLCVPYEKYMIIQEQDGTSSYVNMDMVEELTVEVMEDGQ